MQIRASTPCRRHWRLWWRRISPTMHPTRLQLNISSKTKNNSFPQNLPWCRNRRYLHYWLNSSKRMLAMATLVTKEPHFYDFYLCHTSKSYVVGSFQLILTPNSLDTKGLLKLKVTPVERLENESQFMASVFCVCAVKNIFSFLRYA